MPATVRRHTIELAGFDVPVIEVTGSAEGPRLTRAVLDLRRRADGGTVQALADGVPMFITSSPATATGGLLLGLGAR
jgi:hypothetical protein